MQDLHQITLPMLQSPKPWPEDRIRPPIGTEKKNVRIVWKFMLERVVLQGGPFGGYVKSDKIEKLVMFRECVSTLVCG